MPDMAEVLEDFSFTNRAEGFPVRYDWDSWLDGQVWKLKQGEDFTISLVNLRNSVFVAASKRNLKVRTTTNKEEGTVIIQALPPVSE
jgi:hypothetical protein